MHHSELGMQIKQIGVGLSGRGVHCWEHELETGLAGVL